MSSDAKLEGDAQSDYSNYCRGPFTALSTGTLDTVLMQVNR